MSKRKICVVTGTRAEYGLLYGLMKSIKNYNEFELQTLVTGMHLSPEFGLTYKNIKEDGFKINRKIEILLSSDNPASISKSVALGLISFADAYNELEPDLIIILGDRFEALSAAIAASFAKIPILHIHGGEVTAGAFDESIRHSITKMSWWHFVAAKEYKNRVIQLGENPKRVFNVGGFGVDLIKKTKLISKNQLMNELGIKFGDKNLLITYHPETLDNESSKNKMKVILKALHNFDDINFIFTMPNADQENYALKQLINDFVLSHSDRSIAFNSMGYVNYLSTLQFIDGVVGNSSSGLLEAPTFNIGTVNIGERQKGRLKASSVIDCDISTESINDAINTLYTNKFNKVIMTTKNPYGNGGAVKKVFNFLKKEKFPKTLKKDFFDL
jgi:GDP/UDP-N,N'-diacetylbacillosamine 2-epimerase (hydrolysing)